MVAIAADVLLIAVDAAVVDLVTIAVDSLLIVADAAAALPDAVVEPVATSARGRARNAAAAARCCARCTAAETIMRGFQRERARQLSYFFSGLHRRLFFSDCFSPKHL